MSKGKMKFVLVVEGESAEELFAVGPKDLMNHFLPKDLNIKKEDVKKCWFEKNSDPDAFLEGREYTITKHNDNFYGKDAKGGLSE
jgi:hypothetical protein